MMTIGFICPDWITTTSMPAMFKYHWLKENIFSLRLDKLMLIVRSVISLMGEIYAFPFVDQYIGPPNQ